jgi:hypothetical protein
MNQNKIFDYLLMIFIIILLFIAVSCTKEQESCKNYEVEQTQVRECENDECMIIITTIEYCSQ